MDDFCSHMSAAVQARKEQVPQQEAAAQAMNEARAAGRRVREEDSDDNTAPPDGFNDILNEVCEEAGCESRS